VSVPETNSLTIFSSTIDFLCNDLIMKDIQYDNVDAEVDKIIDRILSETKDGVACMMCHDKKSDDGQEEHKNKENHVILEPTPSAYPPKTTQSNEELKKIFSELNNLEALFLSTKSELQNYNSNYINNTKLIPTAYNYGPLNNTYTYTNNNTAVYHPIDYNYPCLDIYGNYSNIGINMNINSSYLCNVGPNYYNYDSMFKF